MSHVLPRLRFARGTTVFKAMTGNGPKLLLVRLMMSVFLIGSLMVPTYAYNSGPSSIDVNRSAHPWITNKAIEYLKLNEPFAYILASQYRDQLTYGSWFADNNSGICSVDAWILGSASWACDSTNHYDPKFRFTESRIPGLDQGVQGSASASQYAASLFAVAARCWDFRDTPEQSLPDSCAVPAWRPVTVINLVGDFGKFSRNGDPLRKAPLTLLGWTLHLIQDVTQVYHTYSMPKNGHQEFEDYVDGFIQAGKGNLLPSANATTPLEVSNPEAFARDIAAETRAIAQSKGLLVNLLGSPVCCLIKEGQVDPLTELSLNRAITYSGKLLSFYLRQPAAELAGAIHSVVF